MTIKFRAPSVKWVLCHAGYNHVCEDCGYEWESQHEDERCPNCRSSATQSYQQH